MLLHGHNVRGEGTLIGWIETEQELQEVADALGAEISTIPEVLGLFPERRYVVEGFAPNAYPTPGRGYSSATVHVIGSWVSIVGMEPWPASDDADEPERVGSEDGS